MDAFKHQLLFSKVHGSAMDQLLASRVKQSSRKRSRSAPRELCPHCDQSLSLKTFKKHKALFCKSDGTWISGKDTVESETSESESKLMHSSLFVTRDMPLYRLGDSYSYEEYCVARISS